MIRRRVAWHGVLWTARIATAAGLAIDAYVHLDLASVYAEGGGTINEGVLFRAEAAVALLAAAAIIATGRRVCYLAGLAVAASALAVMLVSRYIDIGQIGPFPDLYDPAWYSEKLLAAYAEGAAAATALAGAITTGPTGKSGPRAAPRQRLTGNRTNQQEEYHHDECLRQAAPPPPRGRSRWPGSGRAAGRLQQRKQQHRELGCRGQRTAERQRDNGL